MAYGSILRSRRMQDVIDAIDGKTFVASSGSAVAGTLVIGTIALSGGSDGVLASFTLATPSFVESGGVITLQGLPIQATVAATGAAARAELRDHTGAVQRSGLTVGTAGTDIIIGRTDLTAGQTLAVLSGTITDG